MLTEPTMSTLLGTTETIHEHPEESNTAEDLAGMVYDIKCQLKYVNYLPRSVPCLHVPSKSQFLVAPSHERSDLSTHYSVRRVA